MNDIVHILILEDNIEKAGQLVFELKCVGFNVDFLSVNNAETMLTALQQKNWDMILANYAQPGFNGIKALHSTNCRRAVCQLLRRSIDRQRPGQGSFKGIWPEGSKNRRRMAQFPFHFGRIGRHRCG
ncbi:MAG: hypothetical protein ABSE06_02700 [Anaerolineaceae bacterium]|jgi:hypothetical protein